MTHALPLTPDAYDVQLRELGLVEHHSEDALDNLTSLAARVLNTPTAMISVVQPSQDRQFFKSCIGLPDMVSELRQTPLSHSFCQYVQATGQPLMVDDSRDNGQLRDNEAVRDLHMIAYLGVPIHLPDGTAIGALCVVDRKPRPWQHGDLETLQQLALTVDHLIALKQARDSAEASEATARREAEARKTFLAHMSHEIRTPLNGIIGSTDLLMRNVTGIASSPRQQGELLRTVNRSAQSLERLLNDALDIAKIDAGKMELAPTPFDLRETIQDVVQLFSANAARKGIEITHNFTDIAMGELRQGDGFRLGQVLGNLLSNAVKFTDHGRVCLCLRGTPQAVHITLRDSGCGIAPEQIDALFKPFVQAEPTTAHSKGGTGLGMAIVQQMVQLMGGRIRAESLPGEGTTFFLSLPMPVVAPALADPGRGDDHPPVETDAQILRGKRVLVADDSPANRLVLQKLLESLGAEVDKAYDGGDAFGRAVTTRYDILFLDIQMPGYSGLEVLEKLRASPRHVARDALCIAVTGNTLPSQVQQYRDSGFDAWLSKPLRHSDLIRALSPLLAPAGPAEA
ncbi:ATP-binding protein [Epibacterium sp. MM17-32]|uniref:GAF domain-containing hybrid sensor histidine kinase/response regulator n=1 Tax=Epibacterium sp. MM17-32 TaxID=2917734 RepID=UPI001EF5DBD0|nr:GAF domain-containing hybrid sensor histidine kinase/response regulator [Epibacterium sp. MM17-32]MCG7627406.1 ATP-binding protein [Epibacterium sp. MM17-32]